MRNKLGLAAVCLLLSACSTIYVGNVPFTSVEVCSEELASRLHPRSGCLPPTRAGTAQGFYLARYRLQVSPGEAANLGVTASEKPGDSKSDPVNHLPSWIGRVFKTSHEIQGDKLVLRVPPTGNLDFIPLGSESARPEAGIRTEPLVTTDITGVVQKKLSVGAEISPTEVVDRALKFSGLNAAGIPPGLREVLLDQVIKAGYERQSTDAAQGTYYYVSMTPAMLDSLTSALVLCDWRIPGEPGRQTASIIAPTANPGDDLRFPISANKPDSACFKDKLDNDKTIAGGVKTLLKDLQEVASARPDLDVVGIVIGVAILHTVKGKSEMCSRADLGLLEKEGMRSSLKTSSCEELRLALVNFAGTRPAAATEGTAAAGTPLSNNERKQLLLSVHAEYARAAYKALEIQPHTSILAIHWIPAQLRDLPVAKK